MKSEKKIEQLVSDAVHGSQTSSDTSSDVSLLWFPHISLHNSSTIPTASFHEHPCTTFIIVIMAKTTAAKIVKSLKSVFIDFSSLEKAGFGESGKDSGNGRIEEGECSGAGRPLRAPGGESNGKTTESRENIRLGFPEEYGRSGLYLRSNLY